MRTALNILCTPATSYADTEIARRVCHLLEWDFSLPDGWVQATVSGGVVELEGRVEYPREWGAIQRAIANIRGVREVQLPQHLSVEPRTAGVRTAQRLQPRRATNATVGTLHAVTERLAV